jgi:hypothetical protein
VGKKLPHRLGSNLQRKARLNVNCSVQIEDNHFTDTRFSGEITTKNSNHKLKESNEISSAILQKIYSVDYELDGGLSTS